MFSKTVNNKRCDSKLRFFNGKKLGKIPMIFDVKKSPLPFNNFLWVCLFCWKLDNPYYHILSALCRSRHYKIDGPFSHGRLTINVKMENPVNLKRDGQLSSWLYVVPTIGIWINLISARSSESIAERLT